MRHLSEGTLRRLVDEPLAVSTSERQHYTACPRCREQFEAIAANAREISLLLAAPGPRIDPTSALMVLRANLEEERLQPASRWKIWLAGKLRHRTKRPLAAAALAAALVGAVALTPAGSLAQSFITIFQPKQVAAVPVTSSDLRTLPSLAKYGIVHAPKQLKDQPVSGSAAASSAAGMPVLVPGSLPRGVPETTRYDVVPGTSATFTFSAARARKAAKGKPLPAMPPGLDGSTLRLTTGTAVVATYGGTNSEIPALVIGQMKAPKLSSTGVSVTEIENYVLRLPGVSPQLASAIRSIGDLTTTLPIPIPVDLASSQPVTVQGAQGLAVGDSTGVGSLVVWEKNGIVYGVGGTLAESEVLNIANSLH